MEKKETSRLKINIGGKTRRPASSADSMCSNEPVEDYTSRLKGSMIKQKGSPEPTNSSLVAPTRTTGESDKILFERSPRLEKRVPEGEIEISMPPSAGSKPEINWLSTILPTIITIAIAVVVAIAFNNPMMMLYTLPMTVAGVVVSVFNYTKQIKKYKSTIELRKQKYSEHIEGSIKKIEALQAQQREALISTNPSVASCVKMANERSSRLWNRRPSDEDFLTSSIGNGSVDFSAKITIPKVGISLDEDELCRKPQEIYEKYSTIDRVPITCDLLRNQICGIAGKHADAIPLIKNLIVQLCSCHCYTELKIFCIYDPKDEAEMSWIKNLPHCQDASRMSIYSASSIEDTSELLNNLSALLKQRQIELDADDTFGETKVFLPYILVFLLQPAFLSKSHSVNEFLFRKSGLSAGIVMAVESVSQLPKECSQIIEIQGYKGTIYKKENSSSRRSFEVELVDSSDYFRFADSLKDVYCTESESKQSIPSSLTFYEMLGIKHAEEIDIGTEWAKADTIHTLSVPIGMSDDRKRICLDLHEKGHGPHGLIAGTTGSGKSELLQAYILSVAMHYHPYDVAFVIIDFKGGGLCNQFKDLPHLIGAITNIDNNEIQRSLASIKAELTKRQRLFAETDVNSIDKYIEKYKRKEVTIPLPHLVIIVDEFAELKADQPEFMKELVSAARIGRSLGVHLILATQKPSGQVDEQIWTNSRFQICLKVRSPEDSKEVIKSPLAATIREVGRAYLRVGVNEVFELFQSAYSGAKVPGGTEYQVDSIVDRIAIYCKEKNITKLPDICMPPLKQSIPYPNTLTGGQVSIGVYDDPDNQYQGEYRVDFIEKNTFIIGSSLTGKTNLLQCIIRGIADRYSPERVSIYIIDFASMVLKAFEGLNHIGGVVASSEDERLFNLFKMLNSEIERRRSIFFNLKVSSFSAYCEAGGVDLPQIVLLVDNLNGLRELYFQDDDLLLPICRDGLTYGISVIVTNNQVSGVGYKYLTNFSNRLAFFCNDSSEYSSLFEHCRIRISENPGRCIIENGKEQYICQTYLSFPGKKEIDRINAIQGYIKDVNLRFSSSAIRIPEIPKELTSISVINNNRSAMNPVGTVVIGLDYNTVDAVTVDFKSVGMLALTGKDRDRCSREVVHIITALDKVYNGKVNFYIADDVTKNLESVNRYGSVVQYEFIPGKSAKMIVDIDKELFSRYSALTLGDSSVVNNAPLIVLVLNGNDNLDSICSDPAAVAAFKSVIGKYKSLGVCIIAVNFDNTAVSYNSSDLLKKIKEDRKLLFFGSLDELKVFEVPFSTIKKFKKPTLQGDAYLISGNDCVKIKTPTD